MTPEQEKALARRVLHDHLRHAPSAINICVAAHAAGHHLTLAQAGPIAEYVELQLHYLDELIDSRPPP